MVYKTAQERARAELAAKIKAERKKDQYYGMSAEEKSSLQAKRSRELDRFLFTQGRACGMLDGYTGPERFDDGNGGVNRELVQQLNKNVGFK